MRPAAALGAAICGGVAFGAAGIHLEAAGVELARVSILGATLAALAYTDVTEHRMVDRLHLCARRFETCSSQHLPAKPSSPS